MPFEKYLEQDQDQNPFCYDDIDNAALPTSSTTTTGAFGSTLTPTPTTATTFPGTNFPFPFGNGSGPGAGPCPPVRLSIPSYLNPSLFGGYGGYGLGVAPGGGAEVLPVGLLSGSGAQGIQGDHFDFLSSYNNAPKTKIQKQAPLKHPQLPPPSLPQLTPSLGLSAGPYSQTGLDILSVLASVVSRPSPLIPLGPVDLSTSFIVASPQRWDNPIIYCSPSFCLLTGYTEAEVLGRNWHGAINDAVACMKKNIELGVECQISMVNYRKGGEAFVNLVTVIPLRDTEGRVIYYVGFQTELYPVPMVLQKKVLGGGGIPSAPVMSNTLKRLLEDSVSSPDTSPAPFSDHNSPQSLSSTTSGSTSAPNSQSHPLSTLLLSTIPDFIHVLSLKGSFLYVSPSVTRVLGYDADELIGRCLADICHVEDMVPVMRELKEGSASGGGTSDGTGPLEGIGEGSKPRTVDLLFRARTKQGKYVWIESRGRLHVEPGKGRKAIILSGRAKEMVGRVVWSAVDGAGGVSRPIPRALAAKTGTGLGTEEGTHTIATATEFWGTLTRAGTLLVVGKGVKDVLGWDPEELVGRSVWRYIVDGDPGDASSHSHSSSRDEDGSFPSHDSAYGSGSGYDGTLCLRRQLRDLGCSMTGSKDAIGALPRKVWVRMRTPTTTTTEAVDVEIVLYPSASDAEVLHSKQAISPVPVVYQAKLGSSPRADSSSTSTRKRSSWQYELQQLRFGNERLREEIRGLEAEHEQSEAEAGAEQEQEQSEAVETSMQEEEQDLGEDEGQTESSSSSSPQAEMTRCRSQRYDYESQYDWLSSSSLASALNPPLPTMSTMSTMYSRSHPSQSHPQTQTQTQTQTSSLSVSPYIQAWSHSAAAAATAPTTTTLPISMQMPFVPVGMGVSSTATGTPVSRYTTHTHTHGDGNSDISNGSGSGTRKRSWNLVDSL
ncbi:hypothetical protein BT96DRAFT_928210 [Gymnopus androsaceus JB14]|uniref:PAS domain-containing protein n=1 Tax=Gymnopus androsaceus JB14 TaxID=1447944 RepID=A0A6A4GM67_9AGAR|nr:hypothetical protein BT96DRAFT_928210 [Gymnopus androsaceus JB14]